MGESNSTASPLEAVADVTGAQATEAFSLVGNEARLAILLALWDADDPFAEGTWDPIAENVVSFSNLRERVGMRDPGQFNYHLGKLEGTLVEQAPDGYHLLPAGAKIVRSIIASAGFTGVSLAPTDIGLACPDCGASTAITYQNQRVYHVCTECEGRYALSDKHPSGVLGAWIALNPVTLNQRRPEAIYTAVRTQVHHLFALRAEGICPWCSGEIETKLHVCDAHTPGATEPCPACGRHSKWAGQFACTVCKHTAESDLIEFSLHHPAVVAFAWNHGIELNGLGLKTTRWLWTLEENAAEDLVSTEPPHVRVTLRHEGDELQLTYDDALNVVEVNKGD